MIWLSMRDKGFKVHLNKSISLKNVEYENIPLIANKLTKNDI